MKYIEHQNKVDWFIVILLTLPIFIKSYLIWLLLTFFIVIKTIHKHGIIRLYSMPGRLIILSFLINGSVIGFLGFFLSYTKAWPYFRDIIEVIGYFLYWYCSCELCEKSNYDKQFLLKQFLVSCTLVSIVSNITMINGLINGKGFGYGRMDTWFVSIGCALILFQKVKFSKRRVVDYLSWFSILLSFALGFSRTSILILMVFLLVSFLEKPNTVFRNIPIFLCIVIIIFLVFPNQIDIFLSKIVHTSEELNTSISWTEQTINNNWRGYEVYCAKAKYESGNVFNQLFGWGYGSTIDVFGYASYVTDEEALPYLHNGYYTMLIKNGILGVFLMLFYYLHLFKTVFTTTHNIMEKLFLYSLILSMVISSAVIGGSFQSPSFHWIFMICVMYYSYKPDKVLANNNDQY